jgi:NAD(P)-dependent dehydrogenase (short-subunit alcohol dehydrogenase family)
MIDVLYHVPPPNMASVRKSILVTGGVGYIGSHTTIQLVEAGYNVTIVDNLCNSKLACLERVRALSGRGEAISFVEVRRAAAAAAAAAGGSGGGAAAAAASRRCCCSHKPPPPPAMFYVLGGLNDRVRAG